MCQTCKHYEPSAIWRRGWCRNSRLYGPRDSHLVDEDALDCSRGLGSFWEPADTNDGASEGGRSPEPSRPFFRFGLQPQLAFAGIDHGIMAASDLGSGGGESGRGRPPIVRPPDRSGSPGGQERTVSYQPEERYWTDYLRIALPVIGLLVLIGLLWYWASQLIDDGSGEPPPPTLVAAEVDVIEGTPPPPTATPETAPAAITEGAPAAATDVPAPIETPAVAAATEPAGAPVITVAPDAPSADEPDSGLLPQYDVGAVVVVTDPVNVRSEATTESDIVEEVDAGTTFEVTGAFVEGGEGEFDWWPVRNTSTSQAGYIREDLLERSPTQ